MLHAARPLVRLYTNRRYGVRVHHADRVPATGPVILAANHVGWLDGPMLAIYSPRPVHALTKREMFSGRMDRFLRSAGQIPVDRFAPDPARDQDLPARAPRRRRGGHLPRGGPRHR